MLIQRKFQIITITLHHVCRIFLARPSHSAAETFLLASNSQPAVHSYFSRLSVAPASTSRFPLDDPRRRPSDTAIMVEHAFIFRSYYAPALQLLTCHRKNSEHWS